MMTMTNLNMKCRGCSGTEYIKNGDLVACKRCSKEVEEYCGRLEMDFSDLSKKDLDRIRFDDDSWSWGMGGFPLGNRDWSITHFTSKGVECRYKLPSFVSDMVNLRHEQGKNEAQAEIRRALGVRS